MEMWKPTSHTPKYEISSHGQLRFTETGKIRKLCLKGDHKDKLHATIVVGGKHKVVNIAREVLTTFVRKPEVNEFPLHKNGDRMDNHVDNLGWTRTPSQKKITTPVLVTKESTMEKWTFKSVLEAADFLQKSRGTIFVNLDMGFKNGFKVERLKTPKNDLRVELLNHEVVKEVHFGDHVVEVTDSGKVRVDCGPWRKPGKADRGYVRITFQFDKDGNVKRNAEGKKLSNTFDIHRLVCEAFHGSPPEGKGDVHHKDNNKLNNHPSNLEWVSRSYNMSESYSTGTNVAPNEKRVYKYEVGGNFTGEVYKSASEAARCVHGVVSGITTCCTGKRIWYKKFEWSYLEPEDYFVQRVELQAQAKDFNRNEAEKRREKNGPPKKRGNEV